MSLRSLQAKINKYHEKLKSRPKGIISISPRLDRSLSDLYCVSNEKIGPRAKHYFPKGGL